MNNKNELHNKIKQLEKENQYLKLLLDKAGREYELLKYPKNVQ